jgi:hypothetical protein
VDEEHPQRADDGRLVAVPPHLDALDASAFLREPALV